MGLHVYSFLLVLFLILFLVLLRCLCWQHLRPSHSQAGSRHTTLRRLLKPRIPDDCPVCRLATTSSLGGEPAHGPVRPWCEVKSRRGARHPGEHRGFRLSQPAVSVLWHHRGSHPRSRRGWQAWSDRAHPDLSRPALATPRSALDATLRCTV